MEHGLTVPPTHQPSSGSSSEGYSSSMFHETSPRSTSAHVCDGGEEVDGRGGPSGLTRPGQLTYHSHSSGGVGLSPQGSGSTYSPSSPHNSRHPGLPSTQTPPTPVPRAIKVKQLEEENSRLRNEVESLRQQNDDLTRESERRWTAGDGLDDNATALRLKVGQLEDQIEKMKLANSMNVERLTEKISTLEIGEVTLDTTIEKLRQKLKVEESEMAREKKEKCQLEQSLSSLKVEYGRVDGERQIIERERDKLKEELKNSSGGDQAPARGVSRSNSVSGRDAGVLRRLNDTLRDKKLLEDKVTSLDLELNNLKAAKETASQEVVAKTYQLEELRREVSKLREENEMVKHDQLKKAEQEKQWLHQQLESTRSELRAAGQRVEVKERELSTLKERERQLIDYQTTMESHKAETDTELEQTKAQLEEASNENESLESRVRTLESDIEEAKSKHNKEKTSLLSQLEQAEATAAEAQKAHHTAVRQTAFLQQAKEKGDNICDELKKEAEYIMTDLEEANSKLLEAEQERDKAKHQKDKVMNELAKRNKDIEQKEEMIKQLGQQLVESKEQIGLLDIQLQTYHSDFETERRSREGMAAKVEQLREELQMKDKEVKRLHSHLNKNAAMQMKAEMEEMEYLTSEDQEGMEQYSTVPSQPLPSGLIQDGQPLRARDPDRTHPPQGGGHYQMHNPPRYQ